MTPEDPVVAEIRRARVAARNRKASGLEEWRKQERAARRASIALAVLLVGGFALIGLAAIAARLGWLD